MAQIEYCDTNSDHDWELRPPSSTYCVAEFPQNTIDDWISVADLKWSADSPSLPGIEIKSSIAETFIIHAETWARETAHLSSPTQIMMHPSYQAVLGMVQDDKDEIIRLMLVDLRDNRRMWFWALSFITQANPVNRSQAGKLDAMISAWVEWGKKKGII